MSSYSAVQESLEKELHFLRHRVAMWVESGLANEVFDSSNDCREAVKIWWAGQSLGAYVWG
jgi:hypothetical protein